MYTPSAPWQFGQRVTDPFGVQWAASGPNSLKPIDDCYVRLEDVDPEAGDGGDDTVALLTAIDKAYDERKTVQLLGKTYLFEQPVVIDQNVVHVESCGGNILRNDLTESHGTILKSTVPSGTAFSIAGVQSRWNNLTFMTETNGVGLDAALTFATQMRDITLLTKNAAVGMRLSEAFTNTYEHINIFNLDENQQGRGLQFHSPTSLVTGGIVLMDNITVEEFDYNFDFGVDATFDRPERQWRRSNEFKRLQSRRSGRYGMRFGAGMGQMELVNPWAENGDDVALNIHSGAGPVYVRGGNLTSRNTNVNGTVLLGGGNGDAIKHVTFKDTQIHCRAPGGVVITADPSALATSYHEFDGARFEIFGGQPFTLAAGPQMDVRVNRPLLPFTQTHPSILVNA